MSKMSPDEIDDWGDQEHERRKDEKLDVPERNIIAGDTLKAIDEVICKSFPKDYIIKKGELVTVEGYIMGNLVIRLNETHKSGYSHLPFCSAMLNESNSNKFIKWYNEQGKKDGSSKNTETN
jgi:hypothetical protein